MTDSNDMILLEITDGVAVLTLNDPSRANCVSNDLNTAVIAAIDELESRDDIGALLARATDEVHDHRHGCRHRLRCRRGRRDRAAAALAGRAGLRRTPGAAPGPDRGEVLT